MKLLITAVFTIATVVGAAQTATTTTTTTRTQKKTAVSKPLAPITIPKGAVKTDDGYRSVDARGKVWIYRETPFGITKAPYIAPAPKAAPGAADEQVTATDVGDSISFRRTSPFGTTTWQKKKTELSPDEMAIWNRQKK